MFNHSANNEKYSATSLSKSESRPSPNEANKKIRNAKRVISNLQKFFKEQLNLPELE